MAKTAAEATQVLPTLVEWLIYLALTRVAIAHPTGVKVIQVCQELETFDPPARSRNAVAAVLENLYDKGWVQYETETDREIRFYRPVMPFEKALEKLMLLLLESLRLEGPEHAELLAEIFARRVS